MIHRTVQITQHYTSFTSREGFVRIPTSLWLNQEYSDIHQAVVKHIGLWMSGADSIEHLMERLGYHQLSPVRV